MENCSDAYAQNCIQNYLYNIIPTLYKGFKKKKFKLVMIKIGFGYAARPIVGPIWSRSC